MIPQVIIRVRIDEIIKFSIKGKTCREILNKEKINAKIKIKIG